MHIPHNLHLFIVLPLLLLSFSGFGQMPSSGWNTGSAAKEVSKKKSAAKHKLQDLKDHIQNWGMDTTYKHAFFIGGKLNTNGWSGCLDFVKNKGRHQRIWQISFSEIKHEKQIKQKGTNKSFPELGNPSPYVFAKINNLYTFQVGCGHDRMPLPCVVDGNLSVGFRYNGGLSLAMLKPYYLKLMQVDYSTPTPTARILETQYTQSDSSQFLNPNLILGASTWSKTLSLIDYVPGAYFETALTITPGKSKTFVQVITLGCNASLYYKILPIMQG